MKESGYYPMGAEHDPDAPYNEIEPETIYRRCRVEETMVRYVDVGTQAYEVEAGDYGNIEDINTICVDWREEYADAHMSLEEVIEKMAGLLKEWKPKDMTEAEEKDFASLLDEADGWKSSELWVEEDW